MPHIPLRKPFHPYTALFGLLLFSSLCLPVQAKTYILTDGSRLVACSGSTASAGSTIEIPQLREVCLFFRGEEATLFTDCETVGQLLEQRNLVPEASDVLSHPEDTPILDGMTIRVDSIVTRQETYTTTLPREVRYCSDASLPQGTCEILAEGQDGELLCTANITYRNGREIHREILQQDQTIAPVTRIIAQGTAMPAAPEEKPDMPIIQDGYIIMPTGEILTYYKTDYVTATGYTHTDAGCDMVTSTGTTVHYGTVAVDPRFIPYGTRMLIMSHDGERYYGIATAEDCGGAIKRDKMDLYFPTYQECIEFGRRRCTIYFLG